MTSGVRRASVRSRFRWRMISWPAAKQIRCVNPSIATASPSRTRSAIASRMDATLLVVMWTSARRLNLVERTGRQGIGVQLVVLPSNLGDGIGEEPQSGCHLLGRDREGRRHAQGRASALEDEQAPLEGAPLDLLGMFGGVELHADHEPLAADVA